MNIYFYFEHRYPPHIYLSIYHIQTANSALNTAVRLPSTYLSIYLSIYLIQTANTALNTAVRLPSTAINVGAGAIQTGT